MITKEQFEATAARVRAILMAFEPVSEASSEEQRQKCAGDLLAALTETGVDAWAFNDAAWLYAPDEYDTLELNPTFIETWTEA